VLVALTVETVETMNVKLHMTMLCFGWLWMHFGSMRSGSPNRPRSSYATYSRSLRLQLPHGTGIGSLECCMSPCWISCCEREERRRKREEGRGKEGLVGDMRRAPEHLIEIEIGTARVVEDIATQD
jgi:hypothetical protein